MIQKKRFGLIGFPLGHSFSSKYFAKKFEKDGIENASYENFPLENINDFGQLIKEIKPSGLNVTIPYKEQVIPFLTSLDPIAEEVGAVNTIKFVNEEIIGYNTDTYGFERSLAPFLASHHQRALILGTGGASKAVAYSLKKLGLDILFVSRNPKKDNEVGYHELNKAIFEAFKLVINTTPLGTFPDVEKCPDLPYQYITEKHLLYDLVYNPAITKFLENGKNRGGLIVNGKTMLKLQAEKAWEIWNTPSLTAS